MAYIKNYAEFFHNIENEHKLRAIDLEQRKGTETSPFHLSVTYSEISRAKNSKLYLVLKLQLYYLHEYCIEILRNIRVC